MTPPLARDIAAADLIGRRPSRRRLRIVLAEFVLSVVVGLGVAAFALGRGGALGWILGIAALGFAANYALLLVHALALLRNPEMLQRLASSPEWPETLRRMTRQQLWLFVPFSLLPGWLQGTSSLP
jgi:hypothetical protein